MTEFREQSRAPRVRIGGRLGGRAHATVDVRFLDLSLTGARIEHLNLLRPGAVCTVELPPAMGSLVLSARIVHSTIVGSEQAPEGSRHLRYESGLAFESVTAEQKTILGAALEKLIPGGGLGEGQLAV